jgi:hypothetical protein
MLFPRPALETARTLTAVVVPSLAFDRQHQQEVAGRSSRLRYRFHSQVTFNLEGVWCITDNFEKLM